MTLDKVRQVVEENKGVSCSFRFRGTRNQIDEFRGVITETYPAIFTIQLEDNKVKSFSYSDVLIENLEILR